MECMFCQSEISDNDIVKEGIDTRIAGQTTCVESLEVERLNIGICDF